jgi:hypothetical protein
MSTRSPSRSKLRSKPKEGFLERLLDPIDRLSETIYSILILLTFTFAFRIFRLGPNPDQVPSADYVNDLLIGALGATLAWGLIDGVIYAMRSVFERGEKHRLLKRIQSAATDDEKTEAIAEELDHILEPIAGADKRQELYVDVLDHLRDSQPQPVQLTRDDLAGALGSVLVAVIAVTPSLVPLLQHHFVHCFVLHRLSLGTVQRFISMEDGSVFGRYRRSHDVDCAAPGRLVMNSPSTKIGKLS